MSRRVAGYITSLVVLLASASCVGSRCPIKKRYLMISSGATRHQTREEAAEPIITVWIHGTFNNPVFKKFHTCPNIGLWKASDLPETYHLKTIAQILAREDARQFDLDSFYAFGWSGALSFQARELAARDLYRELQREHYAYTTKHGQAPKIRLITHSHGGNVALNLAKVRLPNNKLVIDELIMLGTPIQNETACYVNDPFFKTIYSLYSHADMLQIMDPQGIYHEQRKKKTKPFFSKRTFQLNPYTFQTAIKYNGRAIAHTEFLLSHFITILPQILQELRSWHAQEKENPAFNKTDVEYVLKIKTKKKA
ncbi:hypothetical protein JW872_01755 [Candidatus Babeliales bacterium]|nr:hypothetical protein [Candidatus Babeliales bacterium]